MPRNLVRLLTLACAVGALWLAGCREKIDLPDELFGTYTTTYDAYADRQFSLSPLRVTLGLGEGREAEHPIKAIYGELDRGHLFYTVVYETAFGEDSLVFYAEGGANVEPVLKNRPDIRWQREES